MRLKPQHIVWIVVTAVTLSVGVYLLGADQPGKRTEAGDVVTKKLGTVEGKATSSFDIALQEGGDPGHESDHVFESVKKPAVASASFNVKTLKLDVSYDDTQISESEIRQLLATAGYIQAEAADAVASTLSADGKAQQLTMNQGEKALEPNIVSAKAGIPLKIAFGQGTEHLASITIAEFGVKQDLSQGGATVEIGDPRPGTYEIKCTEGYADATLIVE